MQTTLVVKNGPLRGNRYVLPTGVTTVGRAATADIHIADRLVGKRQAFVSSTPDGFEFVDCESANRTLINGEMRDRARLRDGDEIRVGSTVLGVEVTMVAPAVEGDRAGMPPDPSD